MSWLARYVNENDYLDRRRTYWSEWRGLLLFLLLLLLVRTTVVDWNHVPSRSMAPSIIPGDRIFVDKTAFGIRLPFTDSPIIQWSELDRFDVIVFKAPRTNILTVKRLIGLPGDRVSLQNGELSINEQGAQYEEYPNTFNSDQLSAAYGHTEQWSESILGSRQWILRYKISSKRGGEDFDTVLVPKGHFLMLGDNRDNSGDYRKFGFVPREAIVGKATGILFSLDPENYHLPRWHRGVSAFR